MTAALLVLDALIWTGVAGPALLRLTRRHTVKEKS